MTCSVQVSFLNPTLLGLFEVYQSATANDISGRSHTGGRVAQDGGTGPFDATIDLCASYSSRGLYESGSRASSTQRWCTSRAVLRSLHVPGTFPGGAPATATLMSAGRVQAPRLNRLRTLHCRGFGASPDVLA